MSVTKLSNKQKTSNARPFKVLVLGQTGVGKTALVVRFITRRFIFDYDPTLEQKYTIDVHDSELDSTINYEILDTAGEDPESYSLRLNEYIKWADAFVLVFSVTDKCSFEECTRLRFLIRCIKKPKQFNSGGATYVQEPTVFLIGNKNDLEYDRIVTYSEARRNAEKIGCVCYLDMSVMECQEDARKVFVDLYKQYKQGKFQWIVKEQCDLSLTGYKRQRERSGVMGLTINPTVTRLALENHKLTKRKVHNILMKKGSQPHSFSEQHSKNDSNK